MVTRILAALATAALALALPSAALADTPSRAALLTGTAGRPATPPAATIPPDLLPKVLELTGPMLGTPTDAPPAFERKDFYDLEKFATWAERVRTQADLAALLAEALKTDDAKRRFGERRAAEYQAKAAEIARNRDAYLAAMATAWRKELDDRRKDAIAAANRPSIGLPSRPGAPRMLNSPAYMVAVDGLYPSPYGDAIGVASMIPRAPRFLGVLDAINTGYSAGGWMGNEVVIKGMMAENHKRRTEYERAVRDWDANVKPLWEENERRRAADARAYQALQARIFGALYGWPVFPTNPATGTFSGGMGWDGGRYGTPGLGMPGYGGSNSTGYGAAGLRR